MSARTANLPHDMEGQMLRDAAMMVRAARMVADAIAHFGPADSGRVSVLVRAFRPSYIETTRRVELTEAVRRATRQLRGAILDEVFAEAQWPEYGTISVIVEHGVPVAIDRTESRRL